MSIDRLLIRNFRPHARKLLSLDPGITVITGPTDSGKTSILGALRWLFTNRPRGDSFVKRGESECEVRARIDGRTVARVKGSAGNLYRVDSEEFAAIGSGVPQAVADLVLVDDVCFSGQHDAAFWFGLTSGGVTRAINRIVNLDAIDAIQGFVAKRLLGAREAQAQAEKRLERAQNDAVDLEYVPQLVKEYGLLEEARERFLATSARHDKASLVTGLVTSARVKAKHAAEIGRAANKDWSDLQQSRAALEASRSLWEGASGLLRQWAVLQKAYEEKGSWRSVYNAVGEMEKARLAAAKSRQVYESAAAIYDQVQEASLRAKRCRESGRSARVKLDAESGDRCPLCLRPRM